MSSARLRRTRWSSQDTLYVEEGHVRHLLPQLGERTARGNSLRNVREVFDRVRERPAVRLANVLTEGYLRTGWQKWIVRCDQSRTLFGRRIVNHFPEVRRNGNIPFLIVQVKLHRLSFGIGQFQNTVCARVDGQVFFSLQKETERDTYES